MSCVSFFKKISVNSMKWNRFSLVMNKALHCGRNLSFLSKLKLKIGWCLSDFLVFVCNCVKYQCLWKVTTSEIIPVRNRDESVVFPKHDFHGQPIDYWTCMSLVQVLTSNYLLDLILTWFGLGCLCLSLVHDIERTTLKNKKAQLFS